MKPRFKIVSDWREYHLDEVAQRGSGHTPSQQHPEYWNGGIKWVSLADSSKLDRGLIFDTEKHISEQGLMNSSAVMHPRGTVVLSRDAGVGRSAILADDMAVSQHFIAWRCDERFLHNWFLYHWLQWHKTEFERIATGSTVKTIGLPYFERLRIRLPSAATQERIADILTNCDTAIEKTEQLIEAKERYFSGLIRKLIIDRANSETSWKRAPIHEIADRIQRQTDGGSYPLLTISSASGFVRQEEKYSRYMAGESAKTYTLLRAGEFAYNKGNSLRYEFGCIFQLQDYEAALVPSVYVSFRLRDSVCASYMRHLFAADYLKPQLRALVKTGVRNNGLLNIRPDEFMGTTVPLPPLEEQERISRVLDAARQEIALLNKQLVALRDQKRGLMQKLLTGQWRVNAPKEVCA